MGAADQVIQIGIIYFYLGREPPGRAPAARDRSDRQLSPDHAQIIRAKGNTLQVGEGQLDIQPGNALYIGSIRGRSGRSSGRDLGLERGKYSGAAGASRPVFRNIIELVSFVGDPEIYKAFRRI